MAVTRRLRDPNDPYAVDPAMPLTTQATQPLTTQPGPAVPPPVVDPTVPPVPETRGVTVRQLDRDQDTGSTQPPPPPAVTPPAAVPWTDAAATSAPTSYASPAPPSGAADLIAQWIQANGLTANQSDPNSLHSITQMLHQHGFNAQVDYADSNGHVGGILIDGHPYQLINGSNQWTPLQAWEQSSGGGDASGGLGDVFSGGAGRYGTVSVGDDPFSQQIQGAYGDFIREAMNRLHSTPQQQAIAMEAARSPYEAARRVQLRNAESTLANRGTLGEPGQQSGLLADAVGRIETNLAPAYTGAIANEYGQLADREQGWANTLTGALAGGTNRQSALSDIAIRSLEQSRLFEQFLATYGLDKARTLADIANGHDDRLLRLFEAYLKQAEIAAGGHI